MLHFCLKDRATFVFHLKGTLFHNLGWIKTDEKKHPDILTRMHKIVHLATGNSKGIKELETYFLEKWVSFLFCLVCLRYLWNDRELFCFAFHFMTISRVIPKYAKDWTNLKFSNWSHCMRVQMKTEVPSGMANMGDAQGPLDYIFIVL